MRLVKIVISAALIGMLVFCWYSSLSSFIHRSSDYDRYYKRAELSCEEGLYIDSYENYTKALELERTEELTDKQINAYRLYYEGEEPNSYEVRRRYISILEESFRIFPKRVDYAVDAVKQYMKGGEYKEAKKLCERALADNPKNVDLLSVREEIIRTYVLDYNFFMDYKEGADGYYCANTGTYWIWISGDGKTQSSAEYAVIGQIGPEGICYMRKPEVDGKFYDTGEVPRGIAKEEYLDAGVYVDGICPVQKSSGKWEYVDLDGNKYFSEYDAAGSFSEGKAAVREGENWYLIDRRGNKIEGSDFADIKLNLRGGCFTNGVLVGAREAGKYCLWDEKLEPVSDIQAVNMDIPTEDGLIAFEKDEKWGFIDVNGNIVLQPVYQEAKSFSNGLASVCKEDKWGFICSDGAEVIEPQFLKAGYVNAYGCVMISEEENYYRLLKFNYLNDLVT